LSVGSSQKDPAYSQNQRVFCHDHNNKNKKNKTTPKIGMSLKSLSVHVVCPYNVGASLDIASALLQCPEWDPNVTLHVSTSGAAVALSAHPRLVTSAATAAAAYDKTPFSSLQASLQWSAARLRLAETVGAGPCSFRSFLAAQTRQATATPVLLEWTEVSDLTDAAFEGVISAASEGTGHGASSAPSSSPIAPSPDVIYCSSPAVFREVVSVLSLAAAQGGSAPTAARPVLVVALTSTRTGGDFGPDAADLNATDMVDAAQAALNSPSLPIPNPPAGDDAAGTPSYVDVPFVSAPLAALAGVNASAFLRDLVRSANNAGAGSFLGAVDATVAAFAQLRRTEVLTFVGFIPVA
jgi:hypothetical protein